MATIQKRTTAQGKSRWRVQIRRMGYSAQTRSFRTKTDADSWARKIESAMDKGEHTPATTTNVAGLIDRFIDERLSDYADRKKRLQLLNWWRNELGSLSVANTQPAHIVQSIAKLRKRKDRHGGTINAATVNRYIAQLSAVFTAAQKRWHIISHNPVSNIERGKEPRGRERFLDRDELDALLAACKAHSHPYLYAVAALAVSTGMRRGEIRALTWERLNLAGQRIILVDTKNDTSRSVPLYGVGHGAMLEHAKVYRRIDSPLVFPSLTRPGRPADFDDAFRKAVDSAGITDFRFHDLRHTAASYLAMSGASLNDIAAILGHKTLAMVKRYAHLSDQHTAVVVARMAEKFLS